MQDTTWFQGKRAILFGGMGFIGSNLALKLVELGCDVTIVDAMLPGYGGNLFNINPIRDQITVNYADIRDQNVMDYLVPGQDIVFHLARQVDHIMSLKDPFPDIDINIRGTAVLLEACRRQNPDAVFVHAGTRGQYGPSATLPVDETAESRPRGLHEISSLTAENMVEMYHRVHGLKGILMRLTNIYGPRSQMQHPRYGVVNWFVRLALENQPIQVFGDGKILRDFLYIDDCIDAMLACVAQPETYGEIVNVASGKPVDFIELADTIVAATGRGSWGFAPFSPERKAQEPGDFYADISKITRITGWEPTWSLLGGLRATAGFYRENHEHYW